jgi:hypothetical protein
VDWADYRGKPPRARGENTLAHDGCCPTGVAGRAGFHPWSACGERSGPREDGRGVREIVLARAVEIYRTARRTIMMKVPEPVPLAG